MVVDSSAVLAILFNEPERDTLAAALAQAGVRLMSSVNALETAVVVSARKGPHGAREFDLLLHRAEIEVIAFTADHLRLARDAYQRYGEGRHPAGLNLGDCCAYALSRHTGEPLLFKAGAFLLTDVVPIQ
ncbi:MAG: type II toxin-antitoxin system VapC family toxin [Acidobacteria bacterium]|nr:type II toxin-antitoxin system VapC family toxin [Acidobacteriota bacterium]MYJ05977.1 type II toxin-antitoxin system VapC family toxin [Acidobacteriota bacterium]